MRLCSMCGGVVPENSAFCQGCGAKYEGADLSPPSQPNHVFQDGAFPQSGIPQSMAPMNQIKTNRSVIKYILFSIITLFIYHFVFHHGISRDINAIASRYDGKKTFNYVLMLLLIIVANVFLVMFTMEFTHTAEGFRIDYRSTEAALLSTIGTALLAVPLYLWYHRVSGRIGDELRRRGLSDDFSSSTYWTFYGGPAIILLIVNVVSTFLHLDIPIFAWGSIAVVVLSLVYFHRLCTAFNQLAEHYNVYG